MNDDGLVASLFAQGLPGTRLRPPSGPFDDATFDELVRRADAARAAGHLLAAIDDGDVEASARQRERVVVALIPRLVADLVVEGTLLDAIDALDDVGVEARVLKGTAAAHLDHDRPWRRSFGDADLLVRGDDFDIAAGALLVAGLQRRYPELRPGFDGRFTKAACFVRGDGLEVDLHRTFTMGPFGLTVGFDDLWAGQEAFELGGRTLLALAPEHRLLHACYHAALGDVVPRMHTLRDIAELAGRADLDTDLLARHANGWQAEALVSWSFDAAWTTLDLDPDNPLARWARQLPVSDRHRAAMRSYRTGGGQKFASTSIASVRHIPGWRDRAAFTLALALPTRAYLAASGRTRADRVRWALRSVRNRARR